MKVIIYAAPSIHQQTAARLFAEGLSRHGIMASLRSSQAPPIDCDLAVFWSHRRANVIAHQSRIGAHYLVMERGYVGDRHYWTSLGFDGLNGRATFPDVDDGGERWRMYHADAISEWQTTGENRPYALIMGQVRTDVAVQGINLCHWIGHVAQALEGLGYAVRLRPHPQDLSIPSPVPRLSGTLTEALAQAKLVVTYNSNAGVDAVLAGVPTVAWDAGSMAWPVAAHQDVSLSVRPDRSDWCRRLAWCQWAPHEISDGLAWEYLSHCLEDLNYEHPKAAGQKTVSCSERERAKLGHL